MSGREGRASLESTGSYVCAEARNQLREMDAVAKVGRVVREQTNRATVCTNVTQIESMLKAFDQNEHTELHKWGSDVVDLLSQK